MNHGTVVSLHLSDVCVVWNITPNGYSVIQSGRWKAPSIERYHKSVASFKVRPAEAPFIASAEQEFWQVYFHQGFLYGLPPLLESDRMNFPSKSR